MLTRAVVLTLTPLFTLLPAVNGYAETQTNHGAHQAGMHDGYPPMAMDRTIPTEPGQSAFAAIQEIVGLLEADPETDWRRVDIEGLRQHLIDMNNVTLHARVEAERSETGVRYRVSSPDSQVVESIQRMVISHGHSLGELGGARQQVRKIENGAVLILESSDVRQVQKWAALGFIGWLTADMHHQSHHLALAKGQDIE